MNEQIPRPRRRFGRKLILAVVLIALAGGVGGYMYYVWATRLVGTIEIDGSSTVYPITEAMAEEFRKPHPDVRINVGISGTGGGFQRFARGEIDIADASRPIRSTEAAAATANGIEWVELKVALDGLAVVVNSQNTWVDYLTYAELKKMWHPNATCPGATCINNWNQIRASFPNEPLSLYGPGTDSGTFDYFTAQINGAEDVSRADYVSSEDDNVLVLGVQGNRGALAYFGYAYYAENTSTLKIVPIEKVTGSGPITPTDTTILDNTYPLSRPLFIYVKVASMAKAEVKAFVLFYLEKAESIVPTVGYTSYPTANYTSQLADLRTRFP